MGRQFMFLKGSESLYTALGEALCKEFLFVIDKINSSSFSIQEYDVVEAIRGFVSSSSNFGLLVNRRSLRYIPKTELKRENILIFELEEACYLKEIRSVSDKLGIATSMFYPGYLKEKKIPEEDIENIILDEFKILSKCKIILDKNFASKKEKKQICGFRKVSDYPVLEQLEKLGAYVYSRGNKRNKY